VSSYSRCWITVVSTKPRPFASSSSRQNEVALLSRPSKAAYRVVPAPSSKAESDIETELEAPRHELAEWSGHDTISLCHPDEGGRQPQGARRDQEECRKPLSDITVLEKALKIQYIHCFLL
jgi:hypothetical protein